MNDKGQKEDNLFLSNYGINTGPSEQFGIAKPEPVLIDRKRYFIIATAITSVTQVISIVSTVLVDNYFKDNPEGQSLSEEYARNYA